MYENAKLEMINANRKTPQDSIFKDIAWLSDMFI